MVEPTTGWITGYDDAVFDGFCGDAFWNQFLRQFGV